MNYRTEKNLKTVGKIMGWFIMTFLVSEILFQLNDWFWGIFGLVIPSWFWGIVGLIIMLPLFVLEPLQFWIFKRDRVNKFLISFCLSWIFADWLEFVDSIYVLLSLLLKS